MLCKCIVFNLPRMLSGTSKNHDQGRTSATSVSDITCLIFIASDLRSSYNFREEARDMFYHAYHAYMENAYPADELMPLSCTGRYRGLTPNRGDIDDSLGK